MSGKNTQQVWVIILLSRGAGNEHVICCYLPNTHRIFKSAHGYFYSMFLLTISKSDLIQNRVCQKITQTVITYN